MKSLSILILLGTITALVVGGLFAVSPVLAETSIPDTLSGPAAAAAEAAIAAENGSVSEAEAQEASAPTTGLDTEASAAIDTDAASAEQLASEQSETDAKLGESPNSASTVSSTKEDAQLANAAANEAKSQTDSDTESDNGETVRANTETLVDLDSFINSVSNGNVGQITGIYAEGVLAFSVVGQGGNAAYVSGAANEVTRFGLAADYGSEGLLAHNYLAGAAFFNLSSGQTITVVYGDGSTQDYRIEKIRNFQALQPNSTQSNFVDLDKGGKLSATQLFHQIYNSDNPLVLQTCINNDGVSTWGRIFIIAVPI